MSGAALSTIEFFVEVIELRVHGVGVRIDGVDLRTLVGDGLLVGAETLRTSHWAGRAHPQYAPDTEACVDDGAPLDRRGVIAVLNCSCGILDCGGIFTRLRRSHNEVRWTDFRRGLGFAEDIPEISFNEAQYFGALRNAKELAYRLER